jgi:hypothetical protein
MSHFNGCFDLKNCLNEKASPCKQTGSFSILNLEIITQR